MYCALSFNNNASVVVANSDGEYEDVVDYKPRPKRAAAAANSASIIKADSETLQLHDSQGRIRLCFQCGKSALRDRFMVSCDHCPLHWHLDCLSPPMACPPPNTNKWMCPNHADHVMVCFYGVVNEQYSVFYGASPAGRITNKCSTLSL
jgi:hypothetical protein